MRKYTCTLFFIQCAFNFVWSYTITDETTLHTDLMNGYDRSIRPGADRSQPLDILITFYFVSLKEFDESEGRFAVTGALGIEWNDNRLLWNPVNYGNDLYSTTFLQSQIWFPYIVNIKSFNSMKKLGDNFMSLLVLNSGNILWVPPDVFESTCDADVTYYPFDSQKCTLRLYVPGATPTSIRLVPKSKTLDMKMYETNGLWEITATRMYSAVNAYDFEEIRLEISMKRRTIYYIAGLILPICVMSFLQVVTFVLPVESGERVGFSVTVLLAVAVFLTIIQDKLPEASEPSVSYLTYKLLVDLIVGCIMVVAVVCGLRFYRKDKSKPVPAYLRCISLMTSFKYCAFKKHNVIETEKEANEKYEHDYDVKDDVSWEEVGVTFDKIFFVLFTFAFLLNNIVYLIIMGSQL